MQLTEVVPPGYEKKVPGEVSRWVACWPSTLSCLVRCSSLPGLGTWFPVVWMSSAMVSTGQTCSACHCLQGMPISKQPGKKGDMIIHFDVKFPRSIPEDKRRRIAELLPDA